MIRKRSRLEIYLDILRVINRGIKKPTRIMYSTNLSWNPLQEILNSMIKQGLIQRQDTKNRKQYEITEKGKSALRYFDKAKELITAEVGETGKQVYPLLRNGES
ncbi:MAG: DUF4364 family protein [Candidatus Bathyarchaeia archaeon]